MLRRRRRFATFLVLVLSVILAASLHAGVRQPPDAFDLARLSFPAMVRPDVPAVVRVALRSDEALEIAVELYPGLRTSEPVKTLRRNLRLGAAAFDDLLLDVKVLSNAEVQVMRGGICHVVPTPLSMTGELDVLRHYDLSTDTFLGELERIAQDRWCWDPVKYRLVDPSDAQRARRFQAKVGILATQMLKALLVEAHP